MRKWRLLICFAVISSVQATDKPAIQEHPDSDYYAAATKIIRIIGDIKTVYGEVTVRWSLGIAERSWKS